MPSKQHKKRCDACYQRARNSRCNGDQPCKYCADNDLECTYEEYHKLLGGGEGGGQGENPVRDDASREDADAAERDREARRRADRELREREERNTDELIQSLERERRELDERSRRLDRLEQQIQANLSERDRALERDRFERPTRGRPRSPGRHEERRDYSHPPTRDHRDYEPYRLPDRRRRSRSPYDNHRYPRTSSRSPDRHTGRRAHRSRSRDRGGRSPDHSYRGRPRSRSRSRQRYGNDYDRSRDRPDHSRTQDDPYRGYGSGDYRYGDHRGRADLRSPSPAPRRPRSASSRERHQRTIRDLEERLAAEKRAIGLDAESTKARALDTAGRAVSLREPKPANAHRFISLSPWG